MDLRIPIGKTFLPGPLGVASGTFGYGREFEGLTDLSAVHAVYTKAVSPEPRPGNPVPRLAETPAGLLNSIGLANVGVEEFLRTKLPAVRDLPGAIVVNVAGSREQEYIDVVERLEGAEGVWGYEINLSCPNVKEGCLAFGTDPDNVRRLTADLRTRTSRPLIIKLTPNVTDIAAIARAAEEGGADAVSCINTLVGMKIDIDKQRPVLARGTGGLSGPAVKPVGIAAVYKVSRAVSIPVIGIGGICSAEDAIEYLLAGASAVQVGTGLFAEPNLPRIALDGITAYCESRGLNSPGEIRNLLREPARV